MKYKVSELVKINKTNLRKSDDISELKYLDTANLNEGIFNEIVKYNVKKDKIPSRAKRKVKKNDILISTVRPNQKHYGFIKEQQEDYIVSTGFAVLSPDTKKVDPYYLYKYLTMDRTTEYFQVIAENSTSAYPSIKPKVIGDIELNIPEMSIQKTIGKFSKDLDDKIELNNSIISNLEEIAQTLFKHWFVDFEFPNENGQPYKSSGGKMVESELGMIPEGWEIGKLSDISELIMGQSPKSSTYNDNQEGMPLINGASDFKKDQIQPQKHTSDPKRISEKGDFLFGVRATVGNVTYVDKEYALGRGVGIARPLSIKYNEFIYFQLIYGINALEKSSTGSVYISFTRKDLEDMKIILPTNYINDNFHHKTKSLLKQKYNLVDENKSLSRVRDSILPKLLSGEIELI